jgi:hypothetical protein
MSLSDEELRAALERRAAAGSSPVDLGAAARSVAASPRQVPRFARPRPRLLAFGSAVLSVVVAVALVGSLVRRGDAPATDRPPTGGSPALATGSDVGQTASPITANVEAWSQLTWRQPDPAAFIGAGSTFVQDTVANGDGYVVVGYTANGDITTGRIWLTADGIRWRLLTGAAFANVEFDRILRLGDGFLIIGSHQPPGGDEAAPSVSAVWWSPDGEAWEERTAPELGGMVLDQAATGPDGLLALARNLDGDEFWLRSDNDLNWTRRKAIWNPDVRIFSFAAGISGWLALGATGVGVQGENGGVAAASSGAIWTSPDGIAWDAATVTEPGGSVGSAVAVGGGLVALGSANVICEVCLGPLMQVDRPLLWFSQDGTSWTPTNGVQPGADRFGQTAISSDTDGGRVLVFDADSSGSPRIRETIDGQSWHEVANRYVVDVGGPVPDRTMRLTMPVVGRSSVLAFTSNDANAAGPIAWLGSAP